MSTVRHWSRTEMASQGQGKSGASRFLIWWREGSLRQICHHLFRYLFKCLPKFFTCFALIWPLHSSVNAEQKMLMSLCWKLLCPSRHLWAFRSHPDLLPTLLANVKPVSPSLGIMGHNGIMQTRSWCRSWCVMGEMGERLKEDDSRSRTQPLHLFLVYESRNDESIQAWMCVVGEFLLSEERIRLEAPVFTAHTWWTRCAY